MDIGKSSHDALAVEAIGKPIYQPGVANDELALRKGRPERGGMWPGRPERFAVLTLCWQSEVRIGYLVRPGDGARSRFLRWRK